MRTILKGYACLLIGLFVSWFFSMMLDVFWLPEATNAGPIVYCIGFLGGLLSGLAFANTLSKGQNNERQQRDKSKCCQD